nr:aminotransferase class I/II-fold pyridoxal phosphate-dependent enzyme [Salinicola tamaricis]
MQAGLAALQPRLPELLRYQEFGGSIRDREAGANWLSRHWPEVPVTRLQVCSGAQSALLSILTLLKATEPDAVVCCAALTYPGLRAVAGQLGIRLVGLPVDEAGIDPEAFAAACARYSPRALYCNPTLHNPTTYTMPPARREAIAEVARHYQVPIIEDDAYAALPRQPVAPLASYAPELTYYMPGWPSVWARACGWPMWWRRGRPSHGAWPAPCARPR